MKLTAIILLSACLTASAKGYSQKITLSEKNAPLEKVFNEISKQSGYEFLYTTKMMQNAKAMDITVKNVSIQEVLIICFKDQPFSYTVIEKTIVVKPKEPSAVNQADKEELPPPPIDVRGRVVNEKSEPVDGASITIKGTNRGTTTDANGNFTIELPDNGGVLVISYVGYEVIETTVTKSGTINFALKPKESITEEVVVTALGITRQSKSLVYAAQRVNTSELTGVRDPNNVLNSLQGKVANALITQSSGGVGSRADIILRGNRSIQGSNSALIVIDGIPVGQSINTAIINPDDIASVTVLPGASAAALYGSSAGNGVIVITTKKGTNDKISVNVNSGIVFETPFTLPEVQNTYGQGRGGVLDASSGENWGAKMTGQDYTNHLGNPAKYSPQPDNIRDFFETGISLNNSISVSGGTEKAQTYLSYTNKNVQGIVPKNELMQHIVNLRLSNQISKRLSTDAKITYIIEDVKHLPRQSEGNTAVFDIYQIPRNVSLADAKQFQTINSLGVPVATPWPTPVFSTYQNPYWVVNNDIRNTKRDQILGFLSAKYKITDWLSVTGRASLDKYSDGLEQNTYHGTVSWAPVAGGTYATTNSTSTSKWFDVIFEGTNNITKNLKANYHAGAIYQDSRYNQEVFTADGLNVPNRFSSQFATTPAAFSIGSQIQTQSVFGQLNLSYKDAIYFDASLRNDWDSRLPSPHSFQYYSAGVSGIISDLITLPKSISYLKANINYAEVGNGGQFGLTDPAYAYTAGAGNGYITAPTIQSFPDYKPEIVKNLEAGIEARFMKNRLGFTLTYYKNNSINQLLQIGVPAGTGFLSRYINAGNIRNKGIELVLNATPVKGKNFNWDIAFNLATNRNKVIKLTDELKTVYLASIINYGARPQITEGGSYGDLIAHYWVQDDKGNYRVNSNGLPLSSNSLNQLPKLIGNFNPKANLGLTNTFDYKGFSLRVLVDGRFGGVGVSGTEGNLTNSGITKVTETHRENGLNVGGVDGNGQPVSASIPAQNFWQGVSFKRYIIGEFFAYDLTSFRVRELSLGYTIPVHLKFIKSARLSAVARNLFWLYRGSSKLDIPGLDKRKRWFDPDITLYPGNGWRGVEYGTLPSTRSLGFNLNLTF